MKKILSLLTLASAVFAVQVQAQVQSYTWNVLGGVTSNLPPGVVAIDCSAQKDVCLKWTIQLGGAGTEVSGIRLIPSVDGTLPTTPTLAGGFMMAMAANGTTAVTAQTNFSVSGYRFLHVWYTTNATAGSVLTNTLESFVKRNAP